jgi:predicted RND superfamily exporter protein
MNIRENIGRIGFLIVLLTLYGSLFFLPQLANLL